MRRLLDLELPEVIFGAIVVLMLVGLGLGLADHAKAEPYEVRGTVVEKVYRPSSGSTSVATPEEYLMIVDLGTEVLSRPVRPELYARSDVGDTITLTFHRGWLTGARY